MWNPQADGYQLLTDFSVIVPDGTSEGTIKKPNMENKVVDGVTYAFDGWYEDAERTVKANFDGQVHQRTFYYGKYVPVDVTLSYDLDGGTPSIEGEVTPKTVTAGESVTRARKVSVFSVGLLKAKPMLPRPLTGCPLMMSPWLPSGQLFIA